MPTDFFPPPPDTSHPGPPSKSIPVVPPPWSLKAKSWIFLYRDPGNDAVSPSSSDAEQLNANNCEDILQGVLACGSYHPCENVHPDALRKINGDQPQAVKTQLMRSVVIVRYEESPVGPYDELIISPGYFTNPHTGKRHLRITNIYVSTNQSVWNGRRNWSMFLFTETISFQVRKEVLTLVDIPKHRAHFEFEPVGKRDLALKVYHPEGSPAPLDSKKPFFAATLQVSCLPKVPLPKLAPLGLEQPPLARSRYPPGVEEAVIATDDPANEYKNPWLLCYPSWIGSWGLSYISKLAALSVEDGLEWYGDGVSFPQVKFWPVGAYFEGIVGFGASQIVSK